MWCHNGRDIDLNEQQTTDVRLAQSIIEEPDGTDVYSIPLPPAPAGGFAIDNALAAA